MVKIDIHVHTKERSQCGRSSETEQVHAAIAAGLDAIVFTDHGRLTPSERISQLNESYAPFRVFGGIEITIDGEDVLVLGIQDHQIETEKWSYPRLHEYVRTLGGFMAIAHPFRYRPGIQIPIDLLPPDAIEICSNNTPPDALERIVALAHNMGVSPLSNSDGHAAESLGRHYNVLDHDPSDERELLRMLTEGAFSCVVPGADGTSRVFRRASTEPRRSGESAACVS